MVTLGMLAGLWLIYLSQQEGHPISLFSVEVGANAAIWVAMAVLFGWLLTAKHPTGRLVAWRTVLACGFLLATYFVLKFLHADGIHGGPA
jgi:hypothetical protein